MSRYDGAVQLIRLIVVAVAGLVTVAGYLHEGRRLQAIRSLPGDKARDLFEAGRVRDERVMWVVASLLFVGAVVAVVRDLVLTAPVSPG